MFAGAGGAAALMQMLSLSCRFTAHVWCHCWSPATEVPLYPRIRVAEVEDVAEDSATHVTICLVVVRSVLSLEPCGLQELVIAYEITMA